jgi:RpiB/LacA/LacB family sugar-phosphate isomerase
LTRPHAWNPNLKEIIMKLAIAGDSAGAELAHVLAEHLKDRFEVFEVSTNESNPKEYYANLSERVASGVIRGDYDRAILVCGTGIGVSISANKVPGIRAALCHDTYSAERAALSNNAQIITMGSRVVGTELAKTIVDAFLAQTFDEKGRSSGNVAAINAVDSKHRR